MIANDREDELAGRYPLNGKPLSEAARILVELRALRCAVVAAWSERAVLLTREEQEDLRAEIIETCDLLKQLTASSW